MKYPYKWTLTPLRIEPEGRAWILVCPDNVTWLKIHDPHKAETIATAINSQAALVEQVRVLEESLRACVARLKEDGTIETHINSPLALARTALEGNKP